MKKKLLLFISSPFFIILIITLLAYWQVSFFFWTFKWDFIEVVFPWRYHVGECLQQGIFPFWNPYQQTGYPIYADLQCPVWYPELWIVGSFTGYTIYTLHLLFLLNTYLAGVGMYKLSFYFNKNKLGSLIVASIYLMSGFYVGHGQHFFVLVATAYIPFTIYYLQKILEKPDPRNLVKLIIVTFLLISGGYQTLTIITGYLLLTIIVFNLYTHRHNKSWLKKILIYLSGYGIIVILLCLPLLVSIAQHSENTTRLSDGLTMDIITRRGFSIRSFISLVFPYSTTIHKDYFNSDVSVRNMYLGLGGLVFVIMALFNRKSHLEWVYLSFGFVALLAAFGDLLPVRQWLAEFIPLMNRFRMPAYFMLFVIIPLLISLSIHFTEILKKIKQRQKQTIYITFSIIISLLIIACYAAFNNNSYLFAPVKDFIFLESLENLTMGDRIFVQCALHVLLLGIFLVLYRDSIRKNYLNYLIFALIITDLATATSLSGYRTIYWQKSPHTIHQNISQYPKCFPIPYHEKISQVTNKTLSDNLLWRNLGNFQKRITYEGFTSVVFDKYNELEVKYPSLKDSVLSNYLVYMSDNIAPLDSLKKNSVERSDKLYVDSSVYYGLSSKTIKVSENDTIYIKDFLPTHIICEMKNTFPVVLTLLQEKYRGWQLLVDGEPQKLFTSNLLYMSGYIKEGEHTVEFIYQNNTIRNLALISAIVLVILLAILSGIYYKKKKGVALLFFISNILLISALVLFAFRSSEINRLNYHLNQFNKKAILLTDHFNADSIVYIVNSNNNLEFLTQKCTVLKKQFIINQKYQDFELLPDSLRKKYIAYVNFNAYNPPEIQAILAEQYGKPIYQLKNKRGFISIYKSKQGSNPYAFVETNDFEIDNDPLYRYPFSITGKFSYQIDSTNIYCNLLNGNYNDISINKPEDYLLDISILIYFEEKANPVISFQSSSNKFEGYNISLTLNKLDYEKGKWINVRITIPLISEIKAKDTFKAFIWNNGKSPVYIDDYKVAFIPRQ